MPPSRRTKKSPLVAGTGASSLRSSLKDDAQQPNDDGKENQDPVKTTVSNGSGASPPNIEVFDHALFDEEETPAPNDDAHTRSPRTYTAGVGGYNALKSFNGQVYSGMAVGGSHIWNYDPGVWKETKVEPDLWKVDYTTTKRRAKNAPTGSGAAIGTEYHWLIVAHQYVTKTDANTYETHLVGSKYKLAHKVAAQNSWSIPTVKAQREREVELLEDSKRRVQGLPPVLAGEKVKIEKHERGQQKLDALFTKTTTSPNESKAGTKRKRQ